jgi:hypothetical protein
LAEALLLETKNHLFAVVSKFTILKIALSRIKFSNKTLNYFESWYFGLERWGRLNI